MVRRVILLLAATALTCSAAYAGLPSKAGISSAILGQWDEVLDRIEAGGKASRAERYFRAVALLEKGRVDEAIAALTELSSGSGAFSGAALEKIAEHSFGLGRYEEIVAAARERGNKRMLDADAFNYRLGQSYFMLGKHGQAVLALEKVEAPRWRCYAYHTLALIEFAKGDAGGAIKRLGEALEAAQSHPDRGVRKALVDHLRLARGRVIHQAALGSEGLSQSKRNKLYKVAISQLSLIQKESPVYADAMRTLGWCAAEMGDDVRAMASFETAMVSNPDYLHEDLWATGRVLERLEYFEAAADSYVQARDAALEQVQILEDRAEGAVVLPSSMLAVGWGRVLGRLDRVIRDAHELGELVVVAIEASELRDARLKLVGKRLDQLGLQIDRMGETLVQMDKDLYHYLDVIPARALFPKKDRPRIDALLNKQERTMGDIAELEDAIKVLEQTRTWARTGEEMIAKVVALWDRLNSTAFDLARGQLTFLEGLKYRVSVREKELVRLVDARKQENAGLADPLAENREILVQERTSLNDKAEKLLALVARLEGVRGELEGFRLGIEEAMVEQFRESIRAEARQVRLRADEFALDEVQALHLLEESLGNQ